MITGQRCERYEILRPLGRGAMGEVYLARDPGKPAEVALKIVYQGPDPEDRDIIEAERLGAELQKRLTGVDPRVVAVRRYGEADGSLFIEMEYVEGEDLSALLARGQIPLWRAVHIALELCGMLENLQAFTTVIRDKKFSGVVHGDLKPKNIRLTPNGEVKVIDFGIAKALSDTRQQTVNLFASAAYCSPERLETGNMNAESDLWAVGVLLYQMIANRLPFDEENRERLERRIRSNVPPEPLPPSCPEPLRRVVFQALKREPYSRYRSARDLKNDLVRWRAGEPVFAASFSPAPFSGDATVRTRAPGVNGKPVTVAPDATMRTAQPPVAPARKPARKMRPVMGCAMFVLIALATLIGFAFAQYRYWQKSERLKADILTENGEEDVWKRFEDLNGRTHLPGLLWPASSALRKRLIAAADSVILEYRNSDAPSIFYKQWQQARNDLSRALKLDPGNNAIRGRLEVCEGHIDRINASGLKGEARQKLLNGALSHFQSASEQLHGSPDPYLGLARTYAYELNDMDKAEAALKKAEENGHPIGKRERAQLGDGYKRRADRLWRDSRAFVRTPEREEDFLEKAQSDYLHAEDLYQNASGFGDAARNEVVAIQAQQRVDQRLHELQGSAAPSQPASSAPQSSAPPPSQP